MGAGLEEFPAPPGLDLPRAEALLTLLAAVEPLSQPWSKFARALMTDGCLPAEIRELVILRVGSRKACDYILSGHIPVAEHCGLAASRIAAALGEGPAAPLDAGLLGAVDELMDLGRISPRTRTHLEELLSPVGVIELAMLAGQYALIGMLCQTFDLKPETRAPTTHGRDATGKR